MNDNFQSGKTQAIDLDELHVQSANRPSEMRARGEFELDKWGDDPWSSTEESRKKRRWAEDQNWSGDDEEEKKEKPEGFWDSNEAEMKSGWKAPKRGDVLEADDGWGDWDNFGGAPKQLAQEEESKEFGGFRRVQAASQYAQVDTSNYVDGHAQRDDLYRSKEEFGTANVRERRGDPYAQPQEEYGTANVRERSGDPYASKASLPSQQPLIMPEMKLVGEEWGNEASVKEQKNNDEDDMRSSAKISPQTPAIDDIPGVTRASIIIFQADTTPVVYELKKVITTIGRGLDNMVILNDQYASRKHLSINYVNRQFELFALSVDNIASVNKYPITHIVLMNGDQIEVGATRIRFVLGPISDAQMTLSEPVNGCPVHLDPPPQGVRSPKTTRKNLILLIAAVGIIVVTLIVGLIIMAVSKSSDKSKVAQTEITETAAEAENSGAAARPTEEAPPELVELMPSDEQLVDAMLESSSALTPVYMGFDMDIAGRPIRIKITSDPPGARIYNEKDGSLRGTTTDGYSMTEYSKDKFEDKLIVRMDGYADQAVEVDFMTSVDKSVTLEKEAAPEPPKPAPRPAAKPKPKPSKPKPASRPTPGRRVLI